MWRRLRRKSPKDNGHSISSHPPSVPPEDISRSRTLSVASTLPQDAARERSPFSVFRGPSPGPEHPVADALGLHVIYQPAYEAPVDIIFVHGLGGASRKTWSKFQDPSLFWPEQWLPLEPEICEARILTFGYNANFRYGSPGSIANIGDFAKDLLFGMKFGKDRNMEDLRIGRVPVMFVVHSMGGLVVKKAYLLGQNDENYQEVVNSISAAIFLATPHRGTSLAELLNKILSVSFQSPKSFISDLNKSSPALEELNEQFRHVAPRLSILSFYETLQTSVGPGRLMVLEKDSAILGYPGEISKSLNADHHDVCKFTNQDDPNYVSVRNAMKSLVQTLKSKGANVLDSRLSGEVAEVTKLLGYTQSPEDDFNIFQQRRMPGTCQWILSQPEFRLWLQATNEPCIAWYNAPPASGKSTLATFIIEHAQDLGCTCQYFYFRFGDQTRRSTSTLLRSIAVQIAKQNSVFRKLLARLSREGVSFEKADARIVWQKVFLSVLSQITFTKPLYWVIDALDESDSPKIFLNLLQTLSTGRFPIRILLVSRNTELLSLAFERLSAAVPVNVIRQTGQDHISSDIKLYAQQELKYMRGSDELKVQVMQNILRNANSNFLWVHLVLEEISSCHTQQAIQQTLKEIPPGMEGLYQRMDQAIAKNLKPGDRILAKTLISWATCVQRPLSIEELSQALQPDYPEFLDLRRTIQDVCGHFLIVNQASHISMVHQSALEYLTRTPDLHLSVDLKSSHQNLFAKTISFLTDPDIRFKLERDTHKSRKTQPFLSYAATSWPYHLRQAATGSEDTLTLLVTFLDGHSVLTWIHSLAVLHKLEILVRAARALSLFVNLNRKLNAERSPLLHRLQDLEFLESWATDLLKIVGKFGRHLLQDPTAIYRLVPPFCPTQSNMYRQFSHDDATKISVSGITNIIWDDCLARFNLPYGTKAWKIMCAGRYFAVLSSAGSIFLRDSLNFEDICKLPHGEYVTAMCFSSKCDRIISCGVKSTKVWGIPAGEVLGSTPNLVDAKVMDVTFTENDAKIITASDDRVIRYAFVGNIERGWQCPDPMLLKETTQVEGGFITSPCYMAFNPDARQIAVAYRGYPLTVWSTTEPRLIGRCKRTAEHRPDHGRPSVSWMAVDRLAWNTMTGHLVGLYKDGSIFKWHPVGDETQEARTTADEIEVSPDGKLFITSDSNGIVKVWNFRYFSVIFQLSSEDLVAGLAFSPDCTRFYDLRGSSINVWEPNSLIRLSDAEEASSETASDSQTLASASQASDARLESVEPICALAAASRSSLYCVAKEDGVVNLFDVSRGGLHELMRPINFLSVSYLIWSDDAKHIAAVDIGGNITVKRLSYSEYKEGFEIQTRLAAKVNTDFGGIRQVLFNANSSRLFVSSQVSACTWSLETEYTGPSCTIETGISCIWMNHPLEKDLLIGLSPEDLTIRRWIDLSEVSRLRINQIASVRDHQSDAAAEGIQDTSLALSTLAIGNQYQSVSSVSKAMLTQDAKHVLVEVSESSAWGKTSKRVVVLQVLSLESHMNMAIESLVISPAILEIIEVPLGIIFGERLVFLDNDLWMCTFKLYSGDTTTLKRHFFIPRDWASTDALNQCCILDDGTFLLPKDGEVAVIACGLSDPDW